MPQYPCFNQMADSFCAATPTYEARECVSYTAWRGSLLLGHEWPKWWGFAWEWPNAARAAKFVVNGTPAVNSIYCAAPNTHGAGPKGHVAWVIAVGNGYVTLAEYNFLVEYGYDEREASTAGIQFIHLPSSPPPPPAPDPQPQPIPQEDPIEMVYLFNTGAPGIWCLCWGKYFHVTPDDIAAFEALAAKPMQTIGAAGHAVLLANYGGA
jgi:hypothetical protein